MSRIPVLRKVSQHRWIWRRLELYRQQSPALHIERMVFAVGLWQILLSGRNISFFLVLLSSSHMDAFSFYQTFFSMEGMSCVWMHDVGSAWKALRKHWVWGAEAQQIALGLKWSLQQQHMGGGGKWDHTGKAEEVKKHQRSRSKEGSVGQRRWKASQERLEFWGVVLSVSCLASGLPPCISYLSCCYAKIFW